jgi:hypothetical protein
MLLIASDCRAAVCMASPSLAHSPSLVANVSSFLVLDLATTYSTGLAMKSSRSRQTEGRGTYSSFPAPTGGSLRVKSRTLAGRFDSVASRGERQTAFFLSGFFRHLLSGRADEKN